MRPLADGHGLVIHKRHQMTVEQISALRPIVANEFSTQPLISKKFTSLLERSIGEPAVWLQGKSASGTKIDNLLSIRSDLRVKGRQNPWALNRSLCYFGSKRIRPPSVIVTSPLRQWPDLHIDP